MLMTDRRLAAIIKAVRSVPSVQEDRMGRVVLRVLAEAIADDFDDEDFSGCFSRREFLRMCGV